MQEHCGAIYFTDAQLEQMHIDDHERMMPPEDFSKLVYAAEFHQRLPWAFISRKDKCTWFCRYQVKNTGRLLMGCYKHHNLPDTTQEEWRNFCKRVDKAIAFESRRQ